jgi:hypothetical protein
MLWLLVACSGPQPSHVDLQHPWSIRVGGSRYLESSSSYAAWLQEGAAAWLVGRDAGDEGTWYEVHVGATRDESDLASSREDLKALGYPSLPSSDFRAWSAAAFFDLSGYVQFERDDARTRAQLGLALGAFGEVFPCHPRFGLLAYSATQRTGRGPDETTRLTEPAGVHAVVSDLAESDFTQSPVIGHATYQDQVTGVELGVSVVWRGPLNSADPLGESEVKLHGPGFVWLSRPIAEPGQQWDESEVVWLGWAPDLDKVLIVTSGDPRAYDLVPVLFNRDLCDEGVFEYSALWRPLGILPVRYSTEDLPIAVSTKILSQYYVDLKGGASWARQMKGLWSFTLSYLSADKDFWAITVFDHETVEAADYNQNRLYSSAIRAGYQSDWNQFSKRTRRDATYRTNVHGIPAWYLDHYRSSKTKELNFAYGPFVFALDAHVSDADPLLMEDLVARAEDIPILSAW